MAYWPLEEIGKGYKRARDRRNGWEQLWQECLRFGQPSRNPDYATSGSRSRPPATDLFDGTAVDGVEQLAASLLAELTPPWSKWFAIVPGQDIDPAIGDEAAASFQKTTNRIQSHFDRSNFAVEMHQCLLDMVTLGTATLLFEEAPAGSQSAFRFTAIPATEMLIDGNVNGQIDTQYRCTSVSLSEIAARFPEACDWASLIGDCANPASQRLDLIEAVRRMANGVDYVAYTPGLPGRDERPVKLKEGVFETSPFITFRWMKGAGELYGRSPLMSALPDIKTANKVVELILKNASIAVTGIWLAEDDGVLNPANISLVPGSIIPKASGSSGLTPLQSPGRLDVSQLVLEDLRSRIRQVLMTDRLGPISHNSMSATEVLERSAETSRLLGAIYGRLQTELLTPLIRRAIGIVNRRGEIPTFSIDGSVADLQYLSPLARTQSRDEMRNIVLWLDTLGKIDNAGSDIVDKDATARWLARNLGVPAELMHSEANLLALLDTVEAQS